jgi:hypothetical protein
MRLAETSARTFHDFNEMRGSPDDQDRSCAFFEKRGRLSRLSLWYRDQTGAA